MPSIRKVFRRNRRHANNDEFFDSRSTLSRSDDSSSLSTHTTHSSTTSQSSRSKSNATPAGLTVDVDTKTPKSKRRGSKKSGSSSPDGMFKYAGKHAGKHAGKDAMKIAGAAHIEAVGMMTCVFEKAVSSFFSLVVWIFLIYTGANFDSCDGTSCVSVVFHIFICPIIGVIAFKNMLAYL